MDQKDFYELENCGLDLALFFDTFVLLRKQYICLRRWVKVSCDKFCFICEEEGDYEDLG